MINCIAVDDEKLALDLLEDNIKQVPFLNLLKRCKSPLEAIEVLNAEKVDLIFLDVQMPGLTGMQFLESQDNAPMVVLITAYENYALDAFKYDVVDYLVKPVSVERFLKACNKVRDLYQLRVAGEVGERNYFFVNADYKQIRIKFNDIVFIEGMKDYVKIHLASENRPVITRMSLKLIEDKLPAKHFMRIHKSYIVSLEKIAAVKKGFVQIAAAEIPVSDNYKQPLAQALGIGID